MLFLHRALERFSDTRGPGKIRPLLRMRIRRVPTAHALARRCEVVEAVLLHQRGELGAEAAGARGFVHDHTASGLFHGVDQGVEVQGPDAAQVDDLRIDAGFLRGLWPLDLDTLVNSEKKTG